MNTLFLGCVLNMIFFEKKKQTKLKTNSTINHKITLTYKLQTYCFFFWLTFLLTFLLTFNMLLTFFVDRSTRWLFLIEV